MLLATKPPRMLLTALRPLQMTSDCGWLGMFTCDERNNGGCEARDRSVVADPDRLAGIRFLHRLDEEGSQYAGIARPHRTLAVWPCANRLIRLKKRFASYRSSPRNQMFESAEGPFDSPLTYKRIRRLSA